MKTVWTQDLKDPQAKKDYEQGFISNPYINKLRSLLETKERNLISLMVSKPEDADWYSKQMHLNGRLYELQSILSLLTSSRDQATTDQKETK